MTLLHPTVSAIDYSQRFIDVANTVRETGTYVADCYDEGEIHRPVTVTLPSEIDRTRVEFEQGDACNLRSDLGTFDVVAMVNLIDRLPQPRRCLESLTSLVRNDGILLIASPYTWLEEYTARDQWLGGYEEGGQRVDTFSSLEEILSSHFRLIRADDVSFLIREHARKYQWSVSHATLWRRTRPGE